MYVSNGICFVLDAFVHSTCMQNSDCYVLFGAGKIPYGVWSRGWKIKTVLWRHIGESCIVSKHLGSIVLWIKGLKIALPRPGKKKDWGNAAESFYVF